MKNLHIANTDKFTLPFIQFINKYFDQNSHSFLLISRDPIKEQYPNVVNMVPKKGLFTLTKELYNADRIYLHSLFSYSVILLLFMQPWLLKKCSWIIWGGDLYKYRDNNDTVKRRLKEKMRKKVIKKMGRLLPLVEGDYFLAKEWYGAKGDYKVARYVNMERNKHLKSLGNSTVTKNGPINIHVGNSATETNNHFQVFDMLAKYKDENVNVYCPLSYGDMEYAEKVKNYGRDIFGEKFIPIVDFMDLEKYLDHLNNMDIGIFNNDRQQGLGNIFVLLYLGKKVYMKPNTTMSDYFIDTDSIIFSIPDIEDMQFCEFEHFEKGAKNFNNNLFKGIYSDQDNIRIWKDIFKIS